MPIPLTLEDCAPPSAPALTSAPGICAFAFMDENVSSAKVESSQNIRFIMLPVYCTSLSYYKYLATKPLPTDTHRGNNIVISDSHRGQLDARLLCDIVQV